MNNYNKNILKTRILELLVQTSKQAPSLQIAAIEFSLAPPANQEKIQIYLILFYEPIESHTVTSASSSLSSVLITP